VPVYQVSLPGHQQANVNTRPVKSCGKRGMGRCDRAAGRSAGGRWSHPGWMHLAGQDASLQLVVTAAAAAAAAAALPPLHRGNPWLLLYSTGRDGISLATMMRKAERVAPSLLLVKDAGGGVWRLCDGGMALCTALLRHGRELRVPGGWWIAHLPHSDKMGQKHLSSSLYRIIGFRV